MEILNSTLIGLATILTTIVSDGKLSLNGSDVQVLPKLGVQRSATDGLPTYMYLKVLRTAHP